ncbi:hypothetical protein HOP50_02g10150 [Chloropicon primus]|uniref:Uncharacterized protein n=2 Tax=Chloropicon primus TaxID=1764295 RepID=A0A5B8ME21_9CHLO|nr:hypothetical protein A3770_02p10290 [Chloropicon primus]UPQ97720.1 hypothetical protein HOP50_02g10150 [Chloropicon primus]|eukprot:QDZ18511.1 hypothetical protein A3770_02p10290 [Chloropicon primus]
MRTKVYRARVPLVGMEWTRGVVDRMPRVGGARDRARDAINKHVVVLLVGEEDDERKGSAAAAAAATATATATGKKDDEGEGDRVVCFDFLPVEPTRPETVVRMVLNLPTRGETRERQFRRGRKARDCWDLEGEAPNTHEANLARAREFSDTYCTSISLLGNNCETYAEGLVRHLLERTVAHGTADGNT